MPTMLDEELLDALEQRWRDQSPAMIQLLQPGLQNDEIDRLSEPLGFPLPEEVRTWYRWHNGSSNQPIILWRAFGTLADDVTTTLAYEQDEEQWQKGWIQVMDDKPLMIFDCRGGVAAPVPVWHLDYAFAFPTRPVFDSIGDMVSFWIELIDDGQIYWDPNGEQHMREPVADAIHQRIRGVPTD
ncbi:SMI1/KNR4 family protein [Pseudonocardia sp.]|jgi:hypothetical protein|uniref:SMI1/KNR4 family protein n=1 Tax=Pseudonocardia sp. TaxID=60912 RepID=UPI0031FD7439